MNRLQQAMKINAAIDHLYATELNVTEIMQYNAIYSALLDIDELIEAAESEQLDEEVELELTGNTYYDYFSEQRDIGNGFVETEVDEAQPGEFSATFEGKSPAALQSIPGLKRAPVGERVYMEFSSTSVPSYVQNTISDAFEPCGAD